MPRKSGFPLWGQQPSLVHAMPLISLPWVASDLMPELSRPWAPCDPSFVSIHSTDRRVAPLLAVSVPKQRRSIQGQASALRETTLVSRAFVQFVGLTAGRTQSMFDFYADAINFKSLRGSDAIVTLFAYTATLGNGFSGTVSFEDQPDRRAAIGSTIASTTAAPITVGGVSAGLRSRRSQ